MKIAVWKTGHEIADTVAEALKEGFYGSELVPVAEAGNCVGQFPVNIAYGILRGTPDIFRQSRHWFNVDRGYFNPGHYDGYYRISYRGTQARWHDGIPRKAWQGKLEPWRKGGDCGDYILVCPPSEHVCQFFGINLDRWIKQACAINGPMVVRTKNTQQSLDAHIEHAKAVITFNSSVGWKALQMGIPVLSDPDHSIIGSYYNCRDLQSLTDKLQNIPDNRLELFEAMNAHQFTLDEIRQGKAWSLIQHYISSSDGTIGKLSPPMS